MDFEILFVIIGTLLQLLIAHPVHNIDEEVKQVIVTALGESQSQISDLKTSINNSLEEWCVDNGFACEQNIELPFELPVVYIDTESEHVSLGLIKCILLNITSVLEAYDTAFDRDGNKMGMNTVKYNSTIRKMLSLSSGFKNYSNADIISGAEGVCTSPSVEQFGYRNTGQHLKTIKVYKQNLDVINAGLQYIIDGFSQ